MSIFKALVEYWKGGNVALKVNSELDFREHERMKKWKMINEAKELRNGMLIIVTNNCNVTLLFRSCGKRNFLL